MGISLQDQIHVLEKRLVEGYDRIDKAIEDGVAHEAWESFWIGLLKEYEELYDKAWGRDTKRAGP